MKRIIRLKKFESERISIEVRKKRAIRAIMSEQMNILSFTFQIFLRVAMC